MKRIQTCGKTYKANKRIDELNALVPDLTTKNQNKITENKMLITNNIDKINNQVTNTVDNYIVTTKETKRRKDTYRGKPTT